jgi:transposase
MATHRGYKSGQNRDQASFLPPRLEDYVGRDNPVRAIDAYVDSLDLNELGFRDVGSDGVAGQPPHDPADLLKLYIYGLSASGELVALAEKVRRGAISS